MSNSCGFANSTNQPVSDLTPDGVDRRTPSGDPFLTAGGLFGGDDIPPNPEPTRRDMTSHEDWGKPGVEIPGPYEEDPLVAEVQGSKPGGWPDLS